MDPSNPSTTSPSSASPSSSSSVQEEPEYLGRYLVVKHSWRGRYKRLLCISDVAIVTLDPNSLAVTNSYDVATDFEGASPIVGRDESSSEFNLSVRTDGKGKFKSMKFSSKYRASILTELHRLRWNRIGAVAEFPVLHLRRRNGEWVPYKLKVTYIGVELIDLRSGDLRWCLDFRDMKSPAIITLSDAYGKKSDHGGFVLCPLYGRKSKAFQGSSGTTSTTIISNLAKTAKSMVGVSLVVDSSQSLTVMEYIKRREKEAVGAAETPCGDWSVTRLRSAAHGTLNAPGLTLGVGPNGGLGEHGDAISRQLILTRVSLVERRPENYEAVIVRPLSAVNSLVRFAEEPQMFAIEFNDGCPIQVYASTSRDNLLAAVRDMLQIEGQCPVPILPRLTMPGHCIDPPCGRVHLLLGPQRPIADFESASMHLKHLASAAKDAVAEGGSLPGSRAKLWRRIREFNACIPYTGVPPSIEVPEVTLMALITMLPAAPNLPPESPPLPAPSPKAAATVMGFVACLRRLLASRAAASHVMSFPAAVGRIMGLLRNGSEGVAAEAAGLIAALIGGGSGDPSLLADSKGEQHATTMHTKSVLFAHSGYVTIIVNRLKPMSVSPLLSMAIVEVLEVMICEQHGETTQYTVFVELLRLVAGLRRRLFALFGHPAESVRETVAVIMRTIAEEDAIAAEFMRDAALRDGALLRHLLHAFYLPAGERREVSRQLVALWADSYQPALDLLSRTLPPGLVAYLHTRTEGSSNGDSNQEESLISRRQRRLLQQRKYRNAAGIASQENPSTSVNNYEVGDLGRQSVSTAFRGSDNHPKSALDSNYGQSSSAVVDSLASDIPQMRAAQTDNPPGIATVYMPSTNASEASETNVSNSASYDAHVAGLPSGVPAPAQVVVENTPVGSGRLLCNWHEFWKAFRLDHNRADLIWNERTRQELREALKNEVHKLDIEKERTEDIVPGGATGESDAGQDGVPQISWNYPEFCVRYPSLSKEVCVGQYYLRLLLDSSSNGRAHDFPLRDPVAFFRALYHRFLCDADTGLTVDGAVPDELGASDDWCDMGRLDGFGGGGGSSVRELCARAMAIVYEQHYTVIGSFEGTSHTTVLLDRTDDRSLRHRLLLLLKVLMKNLANVEACVLVGGCVLAVDLLTVAHEASERTAIPLQSNLLAATAFMEPLKEWMYLDKDGAEVGPVEKDAIRRLWSKKAIDWTTKCWASGMAEWKRLRDIRELRWTMAIRVPVLTASQVGDTALTILHNMVSAHSDLDDAGEIVTPTPRVKSILSSPRCLPHIAQVMLSGEPSIVEAAAALLKAVVTRNPKAMIRLYSTGAFYFALAYPGSNLLSIAHLFAVTHVHQAFHGGEEAAVASSLPLAKRSVLGGLLPESLLYVLERSGPASFAAAMVSDSDSPEIIWTHKMRAENLIRQVLQHLGDFPQKLSQHCHSLYDYAPMPPFESARAEILEVSGLIEDIVHCNELELMPEAGDAALQTIANLSVSSDLQNALLKAGVLWFLLPLLLQYDSTAEESDNSESHGVGSSVQIAKNMLAVRASQALSRLSGLCSDEDLAPYNAAAVDALKALLTPKLASMLKDHVPKDLLSTLNSNLESPEIIWNTATRGELLKFVDQQRASAGPDGSYDLQDSHAFYYDALSKELFIGNVYLRVYNDQPDSEISEPEVFCVALVDFISCLVSSSQTSGVSDVPKELSSPSSSLPVTSEVQDHPADDKLLPLFECFSVPIASESNIPQLCLSVLSLLTAYAPCLEAMVADGSSLLLLLQMLHSSPGCREGVLHVLYALASTAELAWAAAKHGGVVYILELLLPVQKEIPLQQRAAAASLLAKLVGQPMHGPRVAITLARDGPGEAVVSALEQTAETPELVWTPAMAASLSAQIATMASDLYREQMKGRVVDWDVPEQTSGHQEMKDEPQVGGIYVRLFLKDPKFPLRNPKRFLEGLLDQYLSSIAATHYETQAVDPELPLLLSAALVSLLRVYPALADHVGYLGYVPKLVAAVAYEGRRETMASDELNNGSYADTTSEFDEGSSPPAQTPQERVRLSCLRVLHQLASSTICAEAMAATSAGSPQVVPLLMKAIGWQGGSILALETLKRVVVAGNRARDALVAQGLKVGLVEVLLGILDWRAGGRNGLRSQMKWNESEASIGTVLAVEVRLRCFLYLQVLHAFATEGGHCSKVRELLDSSDIWHAYKDQKHDLFLPSTAQSSAAGVAGLIESSSSRLTYALMAPQGSSQGGSRPPAPSNQL
ncbi:DnaJ homolog subfamily C GRV2 [Linum perenne]